MNHGHTEPRDAHGLSEGLLADTLGYARAREYTGWDYADGMSSRLLQRAPIDNRWVNLAVQETIKRAPVNIRPLMRVEQRRNYKGTALFALANLRAHQLGLGTGPGGVGDTGAGGPESDVDATGGGSRDAVDYATEARTLCDWLVEERTPGYAGFCGASRHEIQYPDFKGLPSYPDLVSTSYAVSALLAASEAGLDADSPHDYAATVRSVEDFVVEELDYEEIPAGARCKYVPAWSGEHYTLNAVALGARALLEVGTRFDAERPRERGRKLLDYVVSRQTERGGWMYRDPPEASHLSMDNHHNGFVVECLLADDALVGDGRYDDALDRGLAFYREALFEASGAPNWDESSAYPRDIHAAAQGIIVFSRAGDLAFAERIVDWTLSQLYAGGGRFHYRKERFYTNRTTLMRWCQAWMAHALATYLRCRTRADPAGGTVGTG
jgi:hypothetical protein